MGDSENMDQSSKKRCASTQLTPENRDRDDEEDSTELGDGTFKKASDEVLATRRILKIKRKEPSAASQVPNPFAGIRLVPTTAPDTAAAGTNTPMAESKSSPAEATDESKQKALKDGKSDATLETDDIKAKDDNDNQCGKRSDDQGTDADTVEGTDQTVDPVKDSGVDKTEIKEKEGDASEATDKNGDNSPLSSFQQHSTNKNAFTGLASTEASGSSFSFGLIPQDGSAGSGSLFGQKTNLPTFNFDFAKNGNSSLFGGSSSSSIINKSEASSAFPPKQGVSVETGEENERVAFSADSVMFEYIDGGWKERGKGEVKVNVSSTSNGKSRLVMRSKGNYRLILNASLYPEMKLTSMDKKGITFACVNSIEEGKEGLSTFALKFKDPLVVDTFRAAVHKHKDSKPVEPAAETPLKTPENSPTDE